MKINKYVILFVLTLTVVCDIVFYNSIVSEKNKMTGDSSSETEVELLEMSISDEELTKIADLIVEGSISSKIKDVIYTESDCYVPISYYDLKVKNYLIPETNTNTNTDKDILISFGVSNIPNEIGFNKNYIFYLKQISECEGNPVYCLVSVSQGLLDIKDNDVLIDRKGEIKSLKHLKEIIKKDKDKITKQ